MTIEFYNLVNKNSYKYENVLEFSGLGGHVYEYFLKCENGLEAYLAHDFNTTVNIY